MLFAVSRRSNLKSERAAALVEFAVVVPLLVLFFVGVFDLGRALNCYMKLAQVAGEGVRMAGSRAMLEPGGHDNLFLSTATCPSGGNGAPIDECPGQFNLQARMNSMISIYGLSLGELAIHSDYDRMTNAHNPTVSVRISASYNGILPLFRQLPLSTQKSGSYLF